ncbi:MAG: hypothetical protein NTV44_04940 [Firmicutes bacterium]|nr:hypothetical protein [Bacillota bacterium]
MAIKKSEPLKKIWPTALIVGEIVLVLFLLAVSIMAMVLTVPSGTAGFLSFILWLQQNTLWFFILIVLPLIALFLLNGYMLVQTIYADKKKKDAKMTNEQLLEEAKRQARAEILQEMEEKKNAEKK